jgi:hypothetical protein
MLTASAGTIMALTSSSDSNLMPFSTFFVGDWYCHATQCYPLLAYALMFSHDCMKALEVFTLELCIDGDVRVFVSQPVLFR